MEMYELLFPKQEWKLHELIEMKRCAETEGLLGQLMKNWLVFTLNVIRLLSSHVKMKLTFSQGVKDHKTFDAGNPTMSQFTLTRSPTL